MNFRIINCDRCVKSITRLEFNKVNDKIIGYQCTYCDYKKVYPEYTDDELGDKNE